MSKKPTISLIKNFSQVMRALPTGSFAGHAVDVPTGIASALREGGIDVAVPTAEVGAAAAKLEPVTLVAWGDDSSLDLWWALVPDAEISPMMRAAIEQANGAVFAGPSDLSEYEVLGAVARLIAALDADGMPPTATYDAWIAQAAADLEAEGGDAALLPTNDELRALHGTWSKYSRQSVLLLQGVPADLFDRPIGYVAVLRRAM